MTSWHVWILARSRTDCVVKAFREGSVATKRMKGSAGGRGTVQNLPFRIPSDQIDARGAACGLLVSKSCSPELVTSAHAPLEHAIRRFFPTGNHSRRNRHYTARPRQSLVRRLARPAKARGTGRGRAMPAPAGSAGPSPLLCYRGREV